MVVDATRHWLGISKLFNKIVKNKRTSLLRLKCAMHYYFIGRWWFWVPFLFYLVIIFFYNSVFVYWPNIANFLSEIFVSVLFLHWCYMINDLFQDYMCIVEFFCFVFADKHIYHPKSHSSVTRSGCFFDNVCTTRI